MTEEEVMRRLIVDILLTIAWAYWAVVVALGLVIRWTIATLCALAHDVNRRLTCEQ